MQWLLHTTNMLTSNWLHSKINFPSNLNCLWKVVCEIDLELRLIESNEQIMQWNPLCIETMLFVWCMIYKLNLKLGKNAFFLKCSYIQFA